MKEYVYRMLLRPPGPGAVPKEGLLECCYREIWQNGKHYWGTAAYNRELTREECSQYEMELHKRSDL